MIEPEVFTNKILKSKETFQWKYVIQIFLKDLKDMRHNKTLFRSLIFFPMLISVGFPLLLIGLLISDSLPSADLYEIAATEFNVYLKFQFCLIPIMVCAMIAGDSFAGEKERKTAETLMTLPISAREIFIGKILAAFFPSIFYTSMSFTIMGFESNFYFWNEIQAGKPWIIFGDASFWILAFITAPLFVLMMVQIAVMLSARISNTKAAQQASMIFIIPVLALLFIGESKSELLTNTNFFWEISAILLGIAAIIFLIGGKAINRERFIATLN